MINNRYRWTHLLQLLLLLLLLRAGIAAVVMHGVLHSHYAIGLERPAPSLL